MSKKKERARARRAFRSSNEPGTTKSARDRTMIGAAAATLKARGIQLDRLAEAYEAEQISRVKDNVKSALRAIGVADDVASAVLDDAVTACEFHDGTRYANQKIGEGVPPADGTMRSKAFEEGYVTVWLSSGQATLANCDQCGSQYDSEDENFNRPPFDCAWGYCAECFHRQREKLEQRQLAYAESIEVTAWRLPLSIPDDFDPAINELTEFEALREVAIAFATREHFELADRYDEVSDPDYVPDPDKAVVSFLRYTMTNLNELRRGMPRHFGNGVEFEDPCTNADTLFSLRTAEALVEAYPFLASMLTRLDAKS